MEDLRQRSLRADGVFERAVNSELMECLGEWSTEKLVGVVQVVELPRESPEQALKLFGGLPNLRLLAIGGDGTVAWILSCIDSIQVGVEDSVNSM